MSVETAAPAAPQAGHDAPAAATRGGRAWWLVAIAVVVPVLAAAMSIVGRHWYPSGDHALEVLRIHDVATRHTPLLGAWSRWGWAHPGPALFYVLAPFERLFGETGVLVGMGLLNAFAIGATVAVAHRRGGITFAALTGLAVALLVRALGVDLVVDPWNPWAALFPFLLFVLLAWSVLCRDWRALAFAVVGGSFVVQAHAGYLPFVVVLLGGAAAYAVAGAIRGSAAPADRRAARRALGIAALVGLVVWLPALVQQAFGKHPNISAMVSYIRHPNEPAAGWTLAWGTFGEELRPVAPWVGGDDDNGFGLTAVAAVWPAALTLAALGAAGLFAWRRGRTHSARLAAIAVVSTAIAVLSTARLTGGFFVYTMRWWWIVAAVANLALVWAVLQAVDRSRLRRAATWLAVGGVVVTGVMTMTDLPARVPLADNSRVVAALSDPVAAALDRDSRYLVLSFDLTELGYASRGLYLELERRGFHVSAEHAEAADLQFGSWRLATPGEVDGLISVADVSDVAFRPPPGSRRIAGYDPLTPAERAREIGLEQSIRAQMGDRAPEGRVLVNNGFLQYVAEQAGARRDDVAELSRLQARGNGFAVYLSPAA